MATLPDEFVRLKTRLQADLGRLEPEIAGMLRYVKIADLPEADADVQNLETAAAGRAQAITNAITALSALADNGWPDIEIREIDPEHYAQLAEEFSTLQVALARFKPRPEVSEIRGSVEIVPKL